jgi:hypothetical protein
VSETPSRRARRTAPREHISSEQPEHVRKELTRSLRGQGDHTLLQWFGKNARLHEQARILAEAILNTPEAEMPKPRSALTKPGDPAQLRGIPAIGGRGNFGGAIAGTQPEAALLAKERQRQRQRRHRDK